MRNQQKRTSIGDKFAPKQKLKEKMNAFPNYISPQSMNEIDKQKKQQKDTERLAPIEIEKQKFHLIKDNYDKDKLNTKFENENLVNEINQCQKIAQTIGTRLPKLTSPRLFRKTKKRVSSLNKNKIENRSPSIDVVIRNCEREMKKTKR